MTRVFHLLPGFYPEPAGGTEVYVAALARALGAHGVGGVAVAPAPAPASYRHEGLEVRRFAVAASPPALDDLYGSGDPVAARGFAELLDRERPDLVHFHAIPSPRQLRATHERGLPALLTYHLATTCPRGTLLRGGRAICDGRLEHGRCARCVLQSHGLGPLASTLVGSLPPAVGRAVAAGGRSGGVWTALRMRELLRRRAGALTEVLSGMSAIVVLCRWAGELLQRNGVDAARIRHSPHGIVVATTGDSTEGLPTPHAAGPLRVAFLGRLVPAKGALVLAAAMRAIPDAPLALDLYAVAHDSTGPGYGRALQAAIAGDARIRLRDPLPNHAVVGALRRYDLLAVPSQGLETGPLVVLEAFAAGVPVLGSDLGGIAELVRPGVDGQLVPHADTGAWARALACLAANREALAQLRAGVRPPRTMTDVAEEMAALYRELASGVTA